MITVTVIMTRHLVSARTIRGDEITRTVVISSERLLRQVPAPDEIQARPTFLFGRSRNMFLSCKE